MIQSQNRPPEIDEFTGYSMHADAFDMARTVGWDAAIQSAIGNESNKIVVDVRAGRGILAMLAVKAGAVEVYAVESHPDYAEKILPATFRLNNMADRIQTFDAKRSHLPKPVDIILADVSFTGMIGCSPVETVAWYSQYLKPGGKILPEKATHSVALVTAETQRYGLDFQTMPRWRREESDTLLTTEVAYHTTDYYNLAESAEVDTKVRVVGLLTGMQSPANFVQISTRAQLTPDTEIGETANTWLRQLIPLPEPIKVKAGRIYDISLAYPAGAQAKDVELSATPV